MNLFDLYVHVPLVRRVSVPKLFRYRICSGTETVGAPCVSNESNDHVVPVKGPQGAQSFTSFTTFTSFIPEEMRKSLGLVKLVELVKLCA